MRLIELRKAGPKGPKAALCLLWIHRHHLQSFELRPFIILLYLFEVLRGSDGFREAADDLLGVLLQPNRAPKALLIYIFYIMLHVHPKDYE